MSLDEIVRGVSRAGVVRVHNAMNPLLWTMAVASPVCFLKAYGFRDNPFLRTLLVGIGALPILLTLIAYFIFMLRDPDRLQSEEFRIKQQAIQVLRKTGRGIDIVDVATDVPRVERVRARPAEGDEQ